MISAIIAIGSKRINYREANILEKALLISQKNHAFNHIFVSCKNPEKKFSVLAKDLSTLTVI